MNSKYARSIKWKAKPTLLEQAITYRKKNPKKWEDRQREIRDDFQGTHDKYEQDLFLETYYENEKENREFEKKVHDDKVSLPAVLIAYTNASTKKSIKNEKV